MTRPVFLLPVLVFTLSAQTITITTGGANQQVLQRDSDGRADLALAGTAARVNGKYVEVRALSKSAPLAGLDWRAIDKVQSNKWSGNLRGIPTGGPYVIEVRAAGTTATAKIENVLVGDLWVLAGQSNMEGVGDLVDVQPRHELVYSFDMTDKWVAAEEPLHTLVNAADRVHWRLDENKQPIKYEGDRLKEYLAQRKKGAGLGLPFAVEMVMRTGVPVGLVPCAHGGTSMTQWDPALKDKGGDSLYGATIRRIKATGGRVKGILWYQGESDANPKAAGEFQKKFEALVAAFRQDTGQADLPFYYVQIGRFVDYNNPAEWNMVQEMQRLAEAKIPQSGMVAAVDLTLDDRIHVGTADLKLLGRRLANLACRDHYPTMKSCGQYRRGPRVDAVKLAGEGRVRVSFKEVNGKLVAGGRIAGFSLHDEKGAPLPAIYKAEFDPTAPDAILLHFQGKLPEGAGLRYGAGKDPYCNVRDEAGMGLPVFGPLPVGQ